MDDQWFEDFDGLSQIIGDFQHLRASKVPEPIQPEFDQLYAEVEKHMDALMETFSDDNMAEVGFHSGAITALLAHADWVLSNYRDSH